MSSAGLEPGVVGFLRTGPRYNGTGLHPIRGMARPSRLRFVVAVCLTAAAIAAPVAQSPPQTTPPVIIPPVPPSPTRIGTGSQGPGPAQRPLFRAGIDLIQVDATVLDKDRRPVRGLTAKDFTVLENGVPQPIVAITEMTASDPEWGPDTWMRTVAPDVKVNNAEDGRVLLLVLDDGLIPFDPVPSRGGRPGGPNPKTAVKQVARAIVERLGPADVAAIIFTSKNSDEQEFTSDRTRLFAAIDRFETGKEEGYGRVEDTFTDAARFLAEIPHRRKAIILVSNGTPALRPPDSPGIVVGKREGLLQDAFKYALEGNVTFYTVNPMLMNGLDGEVGRLLDPASAQDDRSGRSFGQPTSGPPPAPRYTADVRALPLDQLTGGFTIRRTENFANGITQIFRETGSYYLLGYANPNPKDDGKLRTVEVRVNRPDLSVRARAGYFAPKASVMARPGSPNWKAIAGLLPVKDIPMRINVAPFAIPGKKEVALTVVLGLREPLPVDATSPVPEMVSFLTQAYSAEGDRRGPAQAQTAALTLLPNPRGEVKYEVLSLLTLKPGKYHVRFSAVSRLQGRSGSIYYDIEIPDYSKAALSLSGVALSTTPPLVSAPKDVLAKIIPVTPTTQREFAGHRGSAYLRVYQGGKTPIAPVQIAVRIFDTAEKTVFTKLEALNADRFDANRTAEYRFELPVSGLAPGTYLLTFEATLPGASAPVRQDVRFVVREPAAGMVK